MNLPNNILITGASRGLGRALAVGLAERNSCISIVARNKESLDSTATLIQGSGGRPISIVADLGKLDDCSRVISVCKEEMGGIDVIINNVGIWEGKDFQDVTFDEMTEVINVNLRGTIALTQLALNEMIQNKSGHIINIGSTVGLYCASRSIVYAATKFGIWGFSRSIRPLCRKHNIKVTTLFPGSIASDLDINYDNNAVSEAYNGKRMPTADIVLLVKTILSVSNMALIEEVAMPAMKDHYGD